MKTTIKTLAIISVLALFAFTTIPETITKTRVSTKTEKQTASYLEDEKDNSNIKVALLLDTSNSMDGLIDQAKAQLWDIINELSYAKYGGKNPNLSIEKIKMAATAHSNTSNPQNCQSSILFHNIPTNATP